jgi:hypothetical protein
MTLRSNTLTVALAVLGGLAAGPAGALASTGTSLNLTAPTTASTGTELPIGVNAAFADGANGSQALTLFLLRPGAGGCPAGGVAPAGADVLLSREPADQVLIVGAISDELTVPGSWTVCAYMTDSPTSITALASQVVAVSGRSIAQAVTPPRSKVKAHHKHNKKTAHTKPSAKH